MACENPCFRLVLFSLLIKMPMEEARLLFLNEEIMVHLQSEMELDYLFFHEHSTFVNRGTTHKNQKEEYYCSFTKPSFSAVLKEREPLDNWFGLILAQYTF